METPLGVADVECVDVTQPVKVVAILRAGLVPLEHAGTMLPAQEVYHLGLVR